MRKNFWMFLTLLLVIPGLMLTVSCAKKTVETDVSVSEIAKPATAEEAAKVDPSPAEKARAEAEALEKERKEAQRQQELARLEEERLKAQQLRAAKLQEERRQAEIDKQMEAARRKVFLTELVLFDFDSSALTSTAQERLRRKAEWLKQNPNAKVVIEGHCDERGTIEYNLALGWRRAEAAKAFLVDLGIAPARMTTISYGKERPFVKGSFEGAWSQNRRAHFVLP